MSLTVLKVYHSLPPAARDLVASIRGWQLSRLRYGPESEGLVQGALERESWDQTQWTNWQGDRLAKVLEFCVTSVPFYREFWSKREGTAPAGGWHNLENWPILNKETLRAQPEAFVAEKWNSHGLWREHTSGTTGTPLKLWLDRKAIREMYALAEARARRWYGVERGDHWAILGGQQIVPREVETPPFWIWNYPMRQLYLSAYHLEPKLLRHYVGALKKYRIVHILGYTSALAALANYVVETGDRPGDIRVVVTNAEPLLENQRELISRAFDCPVRETYGMSEIVSAASECEAGRLHLWPEVGIVEVLEGVHPVQRGSVGNLVATGLLNEAMPLIRYEVGDRIALSADDKTCSCGRRLPVVNHIEGRCDDLLIMPNGRQIGRLDPVFKGRLPLREAQIIQETATRVRLKYVPGAGFSNGHLEEIASRLHDRLGDVDLVLERVDQIPRGANGKFRGVINLLSRTAGETLNNEGGVSVGASQSKGPKE